MTMKDIYDDYYDYQRATFSYGTWYPRTNLIKNHALPYIGELELTSITGDDIDKLYDRMEKEGLAQNTRFGMQAALSSIFTYAIDAGYMVTNPVKLARTITAE